VPVILADDLTPTQIKAFRLLANRSATWAEWDDDLLRLELDELKLDDFDLALTGFDADQLLEIMAGEETTTEGKTDDDAVPDVTGNAGVATRVMCGSAASIGALRRCHARGSYQALLGTDHVSMLWQDPPYNVNYANSAKDKLRGKNRAILNDNLGDGFYDFLVAALTPALARCDRRGLHRDVLQRTRRAAVRVPRRRWPLVDVHHLGEEHLHDGPRRLPAPVRADALRLARRRKRHWCGDRDQGDVWQIKKPVKNDLHPTMKPVELVERAIRNSSRPGDTVLDCFGGSGTTMIAAEKSGRCARLMELDPKYVDVIVRRWQDHSGKKATRESDGVAFDAVVGQAERLPRRSRSESRSPSGRAGLAGCRSPCWSGDQSSSPSTAGWRRGSHRSGSGPYAVR
jgi:16S rRNA G966 N2-methylase RsmD